MRDVSRADHLPFTQGALGRAVPAGGQVIWPGVRFGAGSMSWWTLRSIGTAAAPSISIDWRGDNIGQALYIGV